MPKKRATRAQTTRAKPTLQASDEDDIVKGLTVAEKKAKVKNIIKDIRMNVELMKKEYEEELAGIKRTIDHHYAKIRLQMSPEELKMTLAEYVEHIAAVNEEKVDVLAPLTDMTNSHPDTMANLQNVRSTLNKYKNKRAIEQINEEGAEGQSTVKTSTRKRGAAKRNGVSFNTAPSRSYTTPMNMIRTMPMAEWGATPLVTPKFDPRLPATPANYRTVQAGEITMSLQGSPLNTERRTLVLRNGEEIDVDIPEKNDIHNLVSMLNNIIKRNETK